MNPNNTTTVNENPSNQIKIDQLKSFKIKLLSLIESASTTKPGNYSMIVRFVDNTNDFSPFCAIMQLISQLKTVRSSLLTSSMIYSALSEWNNESVPICAWKEPRMREFLYWFFHAAIFCKLGRNEEYKITKLKHWLFTGNFVEENDYYMMLTGLRNAFIRATTFLNPSNSFYPIPSGLHGQLCVTSECKTCHFQDQQQFEYDFNSVEFRLTNIRRFHLYFIPQQPWSEEEMNFPVKITLPLIIDMNITAFLHLAGHFYSSIPHCQWKLFCATKQFENFLEMDLNGTLKQLSESVTKICFYQVEEKEYFNVNFYSSKIGNLPVPRFMIFKKYDETEQNDNNNKAWLQYIFSVNRQYLETIFFSCEKSVNNLSEFIEDQIYSDAIVIKATNFNKKKFSSNMWYPGRKWLQEMAKSGSFSSYLYLNNKQDKSSLYLSSLLSMYIKLQFLSTTPMTGICGKCSHERVHIANCSLFQAPDDLVIHLQQEQDNKNKVNVIYPQDLDLTPFLFDQTQSAKYKLKGILSRKIKVEEDQDDLEKSKQTTIYETQILNQQEGSCINFSQSCSAEIANPIVENAVVLHYELDEKEDWDC